MHFKNVVWKMVAILSLPPRVKGWATFLFLTYHIYHTSPPPTHSYALPPMHPTSRSGRQQWPLLRRPDSLPRSFLLTPSWLCDLSPCWGPGPPQLGRDGRTPHRRWQRHTSPPQRWPCTAYATFWFPWGFLKRPKRSFFDISATIPTSSYQCRK